MRVGITGQAGFVGTHLYNTLGLHNNIVRIPFSDCYFADKDKLREFVRNCDVIVHLAAMNRHDDPIVIYNTNIQLVKDLIEAMESEEVTPHVLFSSSTQEERDNLYGKSKKKGRELLEQWATCNNAPFTGLVVPNVYGPFGRPYYNSFIATFCYQLTHGEQPRIDVDGSIKLIYVGSLCEYIIKSFTELHGGEHRVTQSLVPYDFERTISEILTKFEVYKSQYFEVGIIPVLDDINDVNLFNTFRCYIDNETLFPVKLIQHADARGVFVETIKLGVGGQISFSTTIPGMRPLQGKRISNKHIIV